LHEPVERREHPLNELHFEESLPCKLAEPVVASERIATVCSAISEDESLAFLPTCLSGAPGNFGAPFLVKLLRAGLAALEAALPAQRNRSRIFPLFLWRRLAIIDLA
jgi:hypothetical protein